MRTEKYGLKVDDKLVEFVEANALPGIDISSDNFWKGLASIVNNLGPKNRELLQKRKELKQKIDGWHIENRGKQFDAANYKEFLKSIGYLVDEGADFEIETSNVDDEIANIAGPQLVVPITNSRFALNAAMLALGHYMTQYMELMYWVVYLSPKVMIQHEVQRLLHMLRIFWMRLFPFLVFLTQMQQII